MTLVPNIGFYIYKGESLDRESLEEVLYEEEISKVIIKSGIDRADILKDKKQTSSLAESVSNRLGSTDYIEWSNEELEGFEFSELFGCYERLVEFPKDNSLTDKSSLISKAETTAPEEDKSTTSPINVPINRKESLSVPAEKNSYEKCYGIINDEAEDFIGQLFQSKGNGKSTLAERLELDETLTVERCRQLLSIIDPKTYNPSQRRRFMALNYRLSHLGIAPRWRGIKRDRHYKSSDRERSPEQDAYLRDIQVFDMEWVYKKYHGHMVDNTWDGIMEGIFTSETFNTKKAAIIAEMPFTLPQKADYLMLTSDMEKELLMLRTKKTDDLIRSLVDQSMRVHNDLMICAKRNKSKGQKLRDNIQVRVDLWLASKLNPGGSFALIIETYGLMTGTQLTKSNCQRLLLSLNDSLNEVNSKYVLN